jgi:hypothetical protein
MATVVANGRVFKLTRRFIRRRSHQLLRVKRGAQRLASLPLARETPFYRLTDYYRCSRVGLNCSWFGQWVTDFGGAGRVKANVK